MPEPVEIPRAELRTALGLLLAPPGANQPASDHQVERFATYIADSGVNWTGWRRGPAGHPQALLLALRLPGRTAIIVAPEPGQLGVAEAAQVELLSAAFDRMRSWNLHFIQALVNPGATGQRNVLQAAGMTYLAPLVYLDRDAVHPWADPPRIPPQAWTHYRPATHAEFAATLLQTYEASLDCPELTDLRPIDDIIAGHQASGQFDPAWWELLRLDEQVAGVLLLAKLPHTRTAEIVYMGVCPPFRGRGAGQQLLRRALERCRSAKLRRLTLAVDDRNEPAKRLYAKFALREVARRDVWLARTNC